MVATVKKVKEDNDTDFTLGDLLEIYYGLKTAALLWSKVRESTLPKVYDTRLLDELIK